MNELRAKIKTAYCELYCWKCKIIGINTPTILMNDKYIEMTAPNGTQDISCSDCWNRVVEEIQNYESGI